ncbi:hypothetical protein BO86DRAFT_98377 [Aspergillus japonicus CBS 114.51]|uniref:Uncharacterized protein n=1 Tax=Aspergillus japonicus CBS 114.51 TaxID=1448312 RepID=A0A8T8X031_ASPJA|nr:hypothetical protein BO86DRAFT_98377 [Aspergillus japonicus CBS 114.51]RAH81487.1 hypothetical protein BO86DRAFT_98377 [Aspergillus japonicus CBS 114.51]
MTFGGEFAFNLYRFFCLLFMGASPFLPAISPCMRGSPGWLLWEWRCPNGHVRVLCVHVMWH